ncbi:MAG: sugar porter family MFS transporter [Proteobacteria bacterium]|nr:sugar porter family MFS transporter [Pseudomonadota bacterium]
MLILITLLATLSGLLVGYSTAVIAPALEFVTRAFALTPLMQGVVVSAVLVGGFAGSLVAGGMIRRFGERPVLFATGVLFVAGALGSWAADSFATLLAARLCSGLGVGAATMVTPLYVGETAPTRWRGALVSVIQLAITVGILASYLVGAAWTPSGDWSAMLGVGALPGVLLLVAVALVPESPRWYLMHGRTADARRAHERLTGGRGEALPEGAEAAADGDWRDLFRGGNRMVLVVASGLFAFANLSGIDAILYYAPVIFAEVGVGGALGPILATAGIGLVNVLSTVLAMVLIDRLGRRPLLIAGLVPMAGSLLLLSVAMLAAPGAAWTNMLAVGCLCLFVLAFGVSLGPLPYVLMSELFPVAVRGTGMGIASATAWGVNVAVSLSFPVLVALIGTPLVFGLYGAISLLALAFVAALVPETRGRSLELIEANLARGLPVREIGRL